MADEVPDRYRVGEDVPGENYATVDYLGLVPYLISAVQDLSKQNKALEQRITELEGKE